MLSELKKPSTSYYSNFKSYFHFYIDTSIHKLVLQIAFNINNTLLKDIYYY